jgi:hypothetical protein
MIFTHKPTGAPQEWPASIHLAGTERSPAGRGLSVRRTRTRRTAVYAFAVPVIYGSSVMVSWEESSAFDLLTTSPRAPR